MYLRVVLLWEPVYSNLLNALSLPIAVSLCLELISGAAPFFPFPLKLLPAVQPRKWEVSEGSSCHSPCLGHSACGPTAPWCNSESVQTFN